MRKYEHDTYYYGMEVLNTINAKVGHRPDIDRGGMYIWSVAQKMNVFPLMIYYNMSDNDYRGTLEVHRCGIYNGAIKNAVLSLNEDATDCIFDKHKIEDFLDWKLYEDTSLLH